MVSKILTAYVNGLLLGVTLLVIPISMMLIHAEKVSKLYWMMLLLIPYCIWLGYKVWRDIKTEIKETCGEK